MWTQWEGGHKRHIFKRLGQKSYKIRTGRKVTLPKRYKSDHYCAAGKVLDRPASFLPCDEVKIQFWLPWLVLKDSMPTHDDRKARFERQETTLCFELAILSVTWVRCDHRKERRSERQALFICFFLCLQLWEIIYICIERNVFKSLKGNVHIYIYIYAGIAVAQWLRCCATNRKVAGSVTDGVIGIFHWHNPSDRTMALGSTQPLKEMSTRSISWG